MAIAIGLLVTAPVIAAEAGVSIAGLAYDPDSITVEVGDTVTWTNEDGFSHTVTADDASFDSGSLAGGADFARTFSSEGTFTYHCEIHPSMTGTVVVEAAAVTAPPITPEPTEPAPTPTEAAGPLATEPATSTSAAPDDHQTASATLGLAVALVLLAAALVATRRRAGLGPER